MQILDCCKYTRTLYTIYTHLKFKSDDNSSHIFHQWSFQYFSIHILYTQHKFFSFFFFWFYFIIYRVLQYYINSVFSAILPLCAHLCSTFWRSHILKQCLEQIVLMCSMFWCSNILPQCLEQIVLIFVCITALVLTHNYIQYSTYVFLAYFAMYSLYLQ